MVDYGFSPECIKWLSDHGWSMTKNAPLEIKRNYYDNFWKEDIDSLQIRDGDNAKEKNKKTLRQFLVHHNLMGYIVKNDNGLITGVLSIARPEQKTAYSKAKKIFSDCFAEPNKISRK